MILIKKDYEIDHMRKSGRILAETLLVVEENIKPGITTSELDRIAEEFITKQGAKPSFKGLYGFPSSLCISVNEQVVHGIPGAYKLKEGDIISVDCGVLLNGFHGDAARTFMIGNVSKEAKRLVDVTKQAFFEGIKYAKKGNRIGDISHAIGEFVEKNGYSVVKEFQGHGIGREMHEDPQIPNVGKAGKGPRLQPGMTLAIEPMITQGTWEVDVLEDDWTAVTLDGGLAAHYENTVVITDGEPELLTL